MKVKTLPASVSFSSWVWPYGAQYASSKQLLCCTVFQMNTIYSLPIRPTFNEKHTRDIVSARTRQHAHAHKIMQLTSSPPQIILSNSSLTPAVSEHFPRVHSHNQTTKGDQSTRKTKLTHQKISLLPPSLPCSFFKTPKVLCHLLVV